MITLGLNKVFINRKRFSSAQTSALSGSLFSNESHGDNLNWSTVNNVASSNNLRATRSFSLADTNKVSSYIAVKGFGFSLPTTAVNIKIKAEIERSISAFSEGSLIDETISLLRAGVVVGNNKSSGVIWTPTDAYFTYGGQTDNWGVDWTASDINNSQFGIVLSVKCQSVGDISGPNALVDHIRLTAYYEF